MRYPDFISAGDSIGFVAPSFGCATEPYVSAFKSALEFFKENNIGAVLGPNVYEASGIGISNTPKLCGDELTQMYCDESNQLLLSCGGGELMCEILPYVDFEKIGHAKPKWFGGYSDNTNFTFLHTTINDVATIYAPCAGAFGMKPLHPCMDDYYRLITGKLDSKPGADDRYINFFGYPAWEKESLKSEDNPLATINATEASRVCAYPDGDSMNFSGRMIGGCMDVLVTLLGTRFDKVAEFNRRYKDDGIIWFLESCDLNVFAIRRALWQMDNAGWFENAAGFVIGRPLVMGQSMMGLDQYDAVMGILGSKNVPVIMDADIGHVSPSMPVICGSMADVHFDGKGYDITYHLQ